MKKLIIASTIILSALFVSSCQRAELEGKGDNGKNKVHFIIKTTEGTKSFVEYDATGKTYTAKWSNGDKIGMVFGSEKKDDIFSETLSNTSEDGETATFEGTVTTSGEGTFQAVAPANSVEKFYDETTLGFNVGTPTDYKQYPTKTSFDPSCDLLVSKPCDYTAVGGTVVINDLYFTRMLAILKINLKGEYAAEEKIANLKIEGESTLSGRVKITPSTYTMESWTAAKQYAWAEYTDANQQPAINSDAVYLMVNPQTIAIGKSLTITAETGSYNISKTITIAGKDFVLTAGDVTVLNVTITAAECAKKVKSGYILQTTSGAFEDGAKYIFALKDGKDGSYYFINNAGSSNTLTKDKYTVSSGVIQTDETTCVFTANTATTDGCFTLKNANNKYLYTSGSNTTINTNSNNSSDWYPTFLADSKTYKLQCKSSDGRYISTYDKSKATAYTVDKFIDQVADDENVVQYAGAISVFKYDDGKTALEAPANLNVSGMVVSWDAVSGAASYKLTIGSTEYEAMTSTSYTYTGDAGYYDVSVYAIPSDTETYKKSDAATLTKARFGDPTLPSPELKEGAVTANSITVTWTADAQATAGYLCQIYNGKTYISEQSVNTGSVTFTGLTSGITYTIKVNAKAVEGDQAWKASSVASIDIEAKGTQIKDITAAGTYTVSNVTVYAVSGNSAILGDSTGKIALYKSGHGLAVGDNVTISGDVIEYNGVWEFNTATFTDKKSGQSVDHGTAVESTAIPSTYTTSPTITYVHASGTQGTGDTARYITTSGTPSWSFYLSSENTDTEGKDVDTYGYVYGYKSTSISYMPVSLIAEGISTDPTEVTIGGTSGNTVKVTVTSSASWTANTSSDWTVSPTNGKAGSTEVTITASHDGGEDVATLADLVFTMTGDKAATVTVKQAAKGGATVKSFSATYSYGLSGWALTNYTDKSNFYLVPASGSESVATIAGIFAKKTVTGEVVVTINSATYNNGTNPSASTFSLYTSSTLDTQVTATQGGTLPTSSTYTNVTYTVTAANAAAFTSDLAIKITKPGKLIRLKSIKVEFKYSEK